MFTASLSITAQTGNNPSTGDWITNWCMYIMQFHSATEEQSRAHATTCTASIHFATRRKPDFFQKATYCMIPLVCVTFQERHDGRTEDHRVFKVWPALCSPGVARTGLWALSRPQIYATESKLDCVYIKKQTLRK